MTKTIELTIGTEIFNRGDMANAEHFGTIRDIKTDRWGTHVTIEADGLEDGYIYTVEAHAINATDSGNGSTRIVTKEAWNARRIEDFRATLTNTIHGMSDDLILEGLKEIDGSWESRTADQHTVRAALLNEFEKRNGGEAVDSLMDTLEATKED